VLCQGGAEGKPGDKGKTIKLDINVKDARLEDMLRLAVKSDKPAMTGALSFKTKFLLPPGDIDVIRKLQLNGAFGIGAARFTDQSVQEKINTLSHKSEGHPKESDDDNVFSNLKGRFVLRGGAMSFSRLTFQVPGAQVSLNGSYGLEDETFDLHGKLRMKAKVSQTMTGWKSVLLKAADPFFKKNGAGAVLPIKITGTRSHPDFGLDFHRKDDKKAR
ncbi:MAG: AsmA-like C-terminal region-containing protein, partial [Terriglobia bacterium]